MVDFEAACKIALRDYEAKGVTGICLPYDIGDAWVFNGGRVEEGHIGLQKIAVSKETGEVSAFNLPSTKNFALLDQGTAMELLERYR